MTIALLAALLLLQEGGAQRAPVVPEPRAGFVLAKSLFGSNGTQPATMELVFPAVKAGDPWTRELVREEGKKILLDRPGAKNPVEYFPKTGNVFHKVLWFDPVYGEPGILTISGNAAHIKIWRKKSGAWRPEPLWSGEIGQIHNRLRDIEVGDVDGDGQDELVAATHDLGVTLVFEQTADGLVPTAVARAEERLFVHEVEIGDIDGDGVVEFLTTPSEPNQVDGEDQKGSIRLYDYKGGKYVETVVEHFTTRHAKEILTADLDGDGVSELYAALEGQSDWSTTGDGNDTTQIRRWVWTDGEPTGEDLVALPGHLCRFLNAGDTNGDGVQEIVASTRSQGIFSIWNDGEEWKHKVIVPPYLSGGFEHATCLLDWDGNGADDVFVASDSQKSLQRFSYDAQLGTYEPQELLNYRGQSYITWNLMPLPPEVR